MANVPQWTTNRQFTAPSAADLVTITPNATPWANSAYVTVVASTDAAWLLTGLLVSPDDTGLQEMAEIDVATGAAASEVVVTTFRLDYGRTYYTSPGYIPLDNIGNGVRVSVRLRKSNATTNTWAAGLTFYKKPLTGLLLTSAQPQKCYPPAADDVALTLNPTPWASGPWATVVASTGAAIVLTGIIMDTYEIAAEWEYDIGIGAAASEVVLDTLRVRNAGSGGPNGTVDGPRYLPFYNQREGIAASSRLSVRCRCSLPPSRGARVALTYVEKPL